MGQNSNVVRQDLLRGLRWGGLLLLSALLSIAFYRMTISTEAVAREPEPALESETIVEASSAPESAEAIVLEVGEPAAPKPATPVRRTVPRQLSPAPKAKAQVFVPPPSVPAAAPATPVRVETMDVNDLPSVSLDASPAAVAAPVGLPPVLAPPPPEEDPSIRDRARGVVRSVGRIFRLGRRDNSDGAAQDEKKK